jgi:phosphohistidine swiveling domain-containing protein
MYIENRYTAKNRRMIGTKAYNLFRLASMFKVPEFCVISTRAYREYKTIGKISLLLRKEIEDALARSLMRGRVAVRSSCTAEDLAGVSFAGMYATVLNVKDLAHGMRAVVEVWESAGSPRVSEYSRQMDVPAGDMAVIIQHQLDPELSGVMVTQSPFSINEVLIECCEGLGDNLVSGKIVPTRYRIRNKRMVEKKGKDILSQKQLFELIKVGKKIENFFAAPQDVEWAFQKGRLFILQSRPVFVQVPSPQKKGTVWCNANVRETIPDPISPMGWSIFDSSFFPAIMIDVFSFPINENTYRKFRPVEMLSGRLYWNINNTLTYGKVIGPLLDFMGGDSAVDPQMSVAFRAVDIDNLPEILPRPKMLAFTITSLVRLLYYLTLAFVRYGWMRNKIARANEGIDAYYNDFEPSDELKVMTDKTSDWEKLILNKFARKYFGGILLGSFYLALLGVLLSVRLGKKGETLARRSIIGIIDKTGEMAISINRLATMAKHKLGIVSMARLKRLYREDPEFRQNIENFMNDFGHRGPAEFDIASVNWREDYSMLFKVIATAKDSAQYSVRRDDVIKEIIKNSRPYERFVLKAIIPRLEAFIPLRENGKHYYLKTTARTKDQLLLAGKQLTEKGYITTQRDIFFLTLRDLERVAAARMTKREVRTTVEARKRQWREYADAEVPDIIYENGMRVMTRVKKSNVLTGEPLSSGRVKARARIIRDFSKINRLKQGEILVTHHADPGWTPLFTVASGLVIEVGGVICHAAMVARELGIPAISITGATSLITDGSTIELNADEGRVVLK